MDFFLAGYRLFVHFTNRSGRRHRGLQILGSETDRRAMVVGGSVFTHYAYRKVNASVVCEGPVWHVSTSSGLDVRVRDEPTCAPVSFFADWNEARRYAGPMPFTFASTRHGRGVVMVEGQRLNWEPHPMAVDAVTAPFLAGLAPQAVPAAAFLVRNIDYEWKRGVCEKLP